MARLKSLPESFTSGWLENIDKRTAFGYAMARRYHEFTSDLGGVENLSFQQRVLVERALFLQQWIAQSEAAIAEGGDADMGKITAANNTLMGILSKLGLERRQKEIPSLSDYIARREGKA